MEHGRYIFTSDLHLGAEKYAASQEDFISFLANLPKDTRVLYLLGDVFDFWFERRRRPVGFEAVLQALSDTVARGVEVFFLKGNHDWWTFGRLERETGLKVLGPQPIALNLNGKRLVIAHGDDLGPMDFKARLTRTVLKGRLSIFLARYFVPERLLYAIAKVWTRSSRHNNDLKPYTALHAVLKSAILWIISCSGTSTSPSICPLPAEPDCTFSATGQRDQTGWNLTEKQFRDIFVHLRIK